MGGCPALEVLHERNFRYRGTKGADRDGDRQRESTVVADGDHLKLIVGRGGNIADSSHGVVEVGTVSAGLRDEIVAVVVHQGGVGNVESEAIGADIVHTDTLGADAGRHVVYVDFVDKPRLGRATRREVAQGDASTSGSVEEGVGTQVIAIGKLGARIVTDGNKGAAVVDIGHIAHLEGTAKAAGLGGTGHEANLEIADFLFEFGEHQQVYRVAVVAIDSQRKAVVTIGIRAGIGNELQTVQGTCVVELPAGQGAVFHSIATTVRNIDKLAEVLMIGDGLGTAGGAEGRLGETGDAVGAEGLHSHDITRVGLQVCERIGITIDFRAIASSINHVMTRIVGVGDGDVGRQGGNIVDNHLRGFHTRGKFLDSDIVNIGIAIVISAQSETAFGDAGKGHIKVVPAATGRQTEGNGGEGGVVVDIGDDTSLETMSVSRQYIEAELQLVGSVLEGGEHQDGRRGSAAAHIEALAASGVDRRGVVDIGVILAVGVDQVPAEHLADERDRSRSVRQAVVGLEVFDPRQVAVGDGYAGGAERGVARRRLRTVGAVGVDLHRVASVGRKGGVVDGLSVDVGAVHQRVAGIEHHRVVVQVGSVGDIHRGSGSGDAGHTDRLCLRTREDCVGIIGIDNVGYTGESVIAARRLTNPQMRARQCRRAISAAIAIAVVIVAGRQMDTLIGVVVVNRPQHGATKSVRKARVISRDGVERISQGDGAVPAHTPDDNGRSVRGTGIIPANGHDSAVATRSRPELHVGGINGSQLG